MNFLNGISRAAGPAGPPRRQPAHVPLRRDARRVATAEGTDNGGPQDTEDRGGHGDPAQPHVEHGGQQPHVGHGGRQPRVGHGGQRRPGPGGAERGCSGQDVEHGGRQHGGGEQPRRGLRRMRAGRLAEAFRVSFWAVGFGECRAGLCVCVSYMVSQGFMGMWS